MLTDLLPQQVVISVYSETSQSPRGVPNAAWADQPAVPGRLQQTDSTEVTQGQQTTVTDWLLFLAAGAVIKSKDRVKSGGQTFEVVGAPNRVFGAVAEHHVEVRLRSIT